MATIEELISYHNEGEYVDFKREEYNESNKANLIKDVLAFANADYDKDRYIIMGVYKTRDGDIELFETIAKYDSANIQQYIQAHIEPNLKIDYTPFNYEGKNLLILTIKSPNEQPYMIKKQVKFKGGAVLLNIGDCYYRNGSFNIRAERKDFDRMYSKKTILNEFENNIYVEFQNTKTNEIILHPPKSFQLPSFKLKKQIDAIINIRKRYPTANFNETEKLLTIENFDFNFRLNGYDGYNLKFLEELKSELDDDNYRTEEDLYYINEICTQDINFWIGNKATSYLKNVTFELRIPKLKGLHLSTKRYSNPINSKKNHTVENYPYINEGDNIYHIFSDLPSIPHNLRTQAINNHLKIGVFEELISQTVSLDVYVHAENLPNPIKQILNIKIAHNSQL